MVVLRNKEFSKGKAKIIYGALGVKNEVGKTINKKLNKKIIPTKSNYQLKREAVETTQKIDNTLYKAAENPGKFVREDIIKEGLSKPLQASTLVAPIPGSALASPLVGKIEQKTTGKYTKKLAEGLDKVAGSTIENGINIAKQFIPV